MGRRTHSGETVKKDPIKFFYVNSYRRFTSYWLKQYLWYFWKGWRHDVYGIYHRARYGWAPRDLWNLDFYLNKVLAETLERLAEIKCGTPCGYPQTNPVDPEVEPDHDLWRADLKRWAKAFRDVNTLDEEKMDIPTYIEESRKRWAVLEQTLIEMAPWWGGLWD